MKSLILAVTICTLLAGSAFAADEKKSKDDAKKEAPKPVNKICPVEKGEVDPAITVTHEGKVIGFCCEGCDKEFKKEPAKYMAVVEKELKETKEKEKKGKKEDKQPKLNTKCPVTGDDADKALTHEYKGRTIAFCCEGCIDDFKKEPKKYMAKLEEQDKKDAENDKKKDEKKDEKKADK